MKLKILGLLLIIITLLAGCSWQQEEKIAVMDMERVLRESKQAGKLQQELLRIGDQLEEKYNQKQQQLQDQDNKEGTEKDLDQIYQEYLDNKTRLETTLNQEINQILKELTKENKYGIVVTKDKVYYGGIDITDEVIKRLDEKAVEDGENAAGEQ